MEQAPAEAGPNGLSVTFTSIGIPRWCAPGVRLLVGFKPRTTQGTDGSAVWKYRQARSTANPPPEEMNADQDTAVWLATLRAKVSYPASAGRR
jgi:hypothetical protein